METTYIHQFLSWIQSLEKYSQKEAIEYAAIQLGIEPRDIEEWLKGTKEPGKSAQILLKILLRRGHFVEEPELSAEKDIIDWTKKYPCLIYWSEEDQTYLGNIPGLFGACCDGDTMEEVAIHLEEILDMGVETLLKEKQPLPETPINIDDHHKVTIEN